LGQFYHFSIDDVFKALLEASDSGAPLFDHPFFAYLRDLNASFGTRIDLYLFERTGARALTEVSSRFRDDFARAPWLRLGPHGKDYATAPYAQAPEDQIATFEAIYREIDRFAGAQSNAKWVRLHYFSEAYEAAPSLAHQGVEALLLTDKDAAAYRLPEPLRAELREKGRIPHAGIELVRSHARVENLVGPSWPWPSVQAALDAPIAKYGYLSLFTHEYELDREEVRERTKACLAYLRSRSLLSI
jgi:hypothetical protein